MRITVDKNYCKGCGICLSICPKSVYVNSEQRNSFGNLMPEARNRKRCNGCGLCERLCPDGAINVDEEYEAKY